MTNDLRALASASADIETSGRLNAERAAQARAIGGGLVEALVEQATVAASRALAPDNGAVWASFLDLLNGAGLSPHMSCSRTGREIYTLQPAHFEAHLAEIARLGDSQAADRIQAQLLGAIETQRAYTALPTAISTGAGYMAFLRDACPLDYAIVALQDALPLPERATVAVKAQRAEQVRQTRANLARLDAPALSYLCECLHLFLANIRPSALAAQDASNTLGALHGRGLADITETPAQVGHICRRILQTAFNLIAKHKPRGLAELSTNDILHLRVHYQGLPQYKEQQAARRKLGAVKRAEARKAAIRAKSAENKPLLTAARIAALDNALEGLPEFDNLESAVLDMVAAFNTGLGQSVTIEAASDSQAERYDEIASAAQENGLTFALDDESALDDMLELMGLHVDDTEPDLGLGEFEPEPQDPALALALDFETPASLAMAQARPVTLTRAQPAQPPQPAAPTAPRPAKPALFRRK